MPNSIKFMIFSIIGYIVFLCRGFLFSFSGICAYVFWGSGRAQSCNFYFSENTNTASFY